MYVLKEILLVILILKVVSGANILAVSFVPSVSHQVVFQPIWKELSLRGHKVTVITPNPLRDSALTNLTEIDVSFLYDLISASDSGLAILVNHWKVTRLTLEVLLPALFELIFENSNVTSLLNDTSKGFDVVLAEFVTPTMGAFAAKYNCPLIGISSLSVLSTTQESLGIPLHPTLYPDLFLSTEEKPTLFQKVDALLYTVWMRYYYYSVLLPKYDQIVRKHFGNKILSLEEIERSVSLVFVNTNPIIHKPRAYPPGVVELGRLHIQAKKNLPQVLFRLDVYEST